MSRERFKISAEFLDAINTKWCVVGHGADSFLQFENENTFSYYPNPVNDELVLKAQNNIKNVSVYNMLGQEVLRTAPNALDANVNMSELNTGTYFVQVTINDVTETVRIIKK